MQYKIIFRDKKGVKEIQDFSFKRRDQCERYYRNWCNDRNYEFLRVENIRGKRELHEVHDKEAIPL